MNYIEKDFADISEFHDSINFLIVTATEIETIELHNCLKPIPNENGLLKVYNKNNTYYLGIFGLYNIVHVQCEMGSSTKAGSIVTVKNAIQDFDPKAIIMVGIAFGVNKDKQQIGDVLVSETVIPYDIRREGKNDTVFRSPIPPSSSLLFNRFKNSLDWSFDLPKNTKAKMIPGQMLSGETLIDNQEVLENYLNNFPHAIGGEMEGAGVFVAANDEKKDWVIVKGICDFADGNKSHGKKQNQELAIKTACSLCQHVFNSQYAFKDLGIIGSKKKANNITPDKNNSSTLFYVDNLLKETNTADYTLWKIVIVNNTLEDSQTSMFYPKYKRHFLVKQFSPNYSPIYPFVLNDRNLQPTSSTITYESNDYHPNRTNHFAYDKVALCNNIIEYNYIELTREFKVIKMSDPGLSILYIFMFLKKYHEVEKIDIDISLKLSIKTSDSLILDAEPVFVGKKGFFDSYILSNNSYQFEMRINQFTKETLFKFYEKIIGGFISNNNRSSQPFIELDKENFYEIYHSILKENNMG